MNKLLIFLVSFFAITSVSCSNEDTDGKYRVEIWGEDYIENEIPSSEFKDGWTLTYDKFIVNLTDIKSGTTTIPGTFTVDLTVAGPLQIFEGTTQAGTTAPFEYRIAPATDISQNMNADEVDLQLMKDNSYSVYVSGTAVKDATEIHFAWGFSKNTKFDECESTDKVDSKHEATTQITIHGDHLFYESMVDPEAGIRFGVIAEADENQDSVVTKEELLNFSGTQFHSLDNYDIPAGYDIDNLWDYLEAQSTTIGHIDGEGHCHINVD